MEQNSGANAPRERFYVVIASASEAIQLCVQRRLDCFVAEPVIGPATSGRTRWLRRCFGEAQSDSLRC